MSDDINFQTWICPKCHDDHSLSGVCKIEPEKAFSPHPDDNSYIAQQFRILHSKLDYAEAQLTIAIKALHKIDEPLKYHHWEKDSFTRAACFQYVAEQALKEINQTKEIERLKQSSQPCDLHREIRNELAKPGVEVVEFYE